jgi:ferrous-iron efflux pump FieF
LMVVFGLIFTAVGFPRADSYTALGIAILVFFLSFRMGRRVFSSLTDRAPAGMAHDVEALVQNTEHVIGVHDIRVRQAGSQYFAEMHVSFDAMMTLGDAHRVLDQIEEELHKRYPTMHVVTHPEPEGTTYHPTPPSKD